MNKDNGNEILLLADLLKEFYRLLAHSGEQRTLSVMYESQLTLPQVVALHYVSKCTECSVSSISERVGISLGATSHLVDRLVRNGYLSRKENPRDRRMKLIAVTKKGHEFLVRLNESRTSDLISALSFLDSDSVIRLRNIISEMVEKFRKIKGENLCGKE
ncbi:MAG: MarR family transcriptional regulator [Deltaproteobacteria bacterium]|nr:MarR family transcriptional regulator [Deltaproteobacteria bacterium]